MTSKSPKDINLIADPDEASPDRGPLVEDDELADAKADVEKKTDKASIASADEVLAFLEADDEEEQEEIYADSRVPLARDTRPMLAAWHEYKNAMSQVKTTYKLWKIESQDLGGDSQDQRREGIIQSAARIKKSLDVIETDLKDSFPKLKGVAFLTRAEMLIMPTWMHELLGITIEATSQERLIAQAELKERLDGAQAAE